MAFAKLSCLTMNFNCQLRCELIELTQPRSSTPVTMRSDVFLLFFFHFNSISSALLVHIRVIGEALFFRAFARHFFAFVWSSTTHFDKFFFSGCAKWNLAWRAWWRRKKDISEGYFANFNPEFVTRASLRNFWPKYLPTKIARARA